MIKAYFRRRRPTYAQQGDQFTVSVDKHSFPSGYATRAIYVALFAGHLGSISSFIIWFWSISVAVSRVLLGRHHVFDVLAGSLVGALEYLLQFYIGFRLYPLLRLILPATQPLKGLFCVSLKMQTPSPTTELPHEPHSSSHAPVQIVSVHPETKEFVLQTEELSRILLSDECRDRPVCVVSIAGDFRKGKSFLLNFLLKYLSYQQKNQHSEDLNSDWELFENGNGSEFNSDEEGGDQDHEVSSTHTIRAPWLTDTDCPLKGFSWRGGSNRDTTGILMWSEPFVVTCPNGKEVAVLLMDTQGTFDSDQTVKDSATVFALSTMTSSIQVFNVMRNLQEDNLQVLQAFTEYGRIALEVSEDAPFQNLIFLVRDWPFPYEKSYGFRGGAKLLEERLKVKDTQHESLRQVRLFIKSCFETISCFLMPYPGNKVSTSRNFDGRLKDISDEFLDNVQVFAPYLLSPKRLQTKKIGGVEVTGRQLLEYFKVYIEIFKGETMPEPKHMYDATAEANNRAAYVSAVEHYRKKMDEICGGNAPFMNPRALALRHDELSQEAEKVFRETRKYGGQHYSQQFLDQLKESISESYERFSAQNNSKNVFSLLGAPLILIAWMLLLYIVANVLDLIGLDSVAHILTFFASCTFIVVVTYAIFRYQGGQPQFVTAIDSIAEKGYNLFLELVYASMQKAVEQRAGHQFVRTTNRSTNVRSS